MTKTCKDCGFADANRMTCHLTRLPINLEEDYCSKLESEPKVCRFCGRYIGNGKVFISGDGKALTCEECQKALNSCRGCKNFKPETCEFETNSDPMPKVITQTQSLGNNQIMQSQVPNQERINKFCPSCACWNAEYDFCMRKYRFGCSHFDSVLS